MEEEYLKRQFRLTSGDEIVCEVIQWHDDESNEMIVRSAMKLTQYEQRDGLKYFSFRPYMVYVENPRELIILNGYMIEGAAVPSEPLLHQYYMAVEEMEKQYLQREEEFEAIRPTPKDTVVESEEKESAKVIEFPGKTVH